MDGYWNGTNIGVAITVFTAAAIPLLLLRTELRGGTWWRSPYWILELASLISILYFAAEGLSAFTEVPPLPILFALTLLAVTAVTAWNSIYGLGKLDGINSAVPSFDLASAHYVKELSEAGKYSAVLELRESLSRPLHLLSLHTTRIAIGQLALVASQRLGRDLTESAILIDDIGWASFEIDDLAGATKALGEAERVLDLYIAKNGPNRVDAAFLRIKMLRHRAAIEANSDVNAALASIRSARDQLSEIDPEVAIVESVGLDVGEAYVYLLHCETKFGEQSKIPSDTEEGRELLRYETVLSAAYSHYEREGDVERASKTAALEARAAKLCDDRRAEQAALGKLERNRILVLRNADIWRGGESR